MLVYSFLLGLHVAVFLAGCEETAVPTKKTSLRESLGGSNNAAAVPAPESLGSTIHESTKPELAPVKPDPVVEEEKEPMSPGPLVPPVDEGSELDAEEDSDSEEEESVDDDDCESEDDEADEVTDVGEDGYESEEEDEYVEAIVEAAVNSIEPKSRDDDVQPVGSREDDIEAVQAVAIREPVVRSVHRHWAASLHLDEIYPRLSFELKRRRAAWIPTLDWAGQGLYAAGRGVLTAPWKGMKLVKWTSTQLIKKVLLPIMKSGMAYPKQAMLISLAVGAFTAVVSLDRGFLGTSRFLGLLRIELWTVLLTLLPAMVFTVNWMNGRTTVFRPKVDSFGEVASFLADATQCFAVMYAVHQIYNLVELARIGEELDINQLRADGCHGFSVNPADIVEMTCTYYREPVTLSSVRLATRVHRFISHVWWAIFSGK